MLENILRLPGINMCGLVGCAGKLWNKEESAFKLMLQLDTVRGSHSTGILSVQRKPGETKMFKYLGTPWDLMQYKDFDDVMKKVNGALLGHNRAATRGRITVANAHPFEHEHIIGAHNGTLRSTTTLKDHKLFDVDSDNIFYNISEEGAEETIKKLEGAFALSWYDAHQHTINLVRNVERPLTYCFSKDGETVFWASEGWMLHVALTKNGIDFGEIKQLEPGILMSINVPRLIKDAPTALGVNFTKVELYTTPPVKNDYDYLFRDPPDKTEEASKNKNKELVVHPKVTSLLDRRNLKNRLQTFQNKSLVFSVVKYLKEGSQQYFLCDVEDVVNPPEIRIFTTKDTVLGKLLFNSSNLFKGKVCGFSMSGNKDSGYLRVDHRSIYEVNSSTDDPFLSDDNTIKKALDSMVFTVFNDKKVDAQAWFDLTSRGCVDCGDIPSVSSRDNLLWIGGREFFCTNCKNGALAAQMTQ